MDRFLIGPIDIGLQTDLKPFLIPDQAYAQLNNAYVFRGRVRKRFGSRYTGATQLSSRFRVTNWTITAGAASGTVPGSVFSIGQAFSVGSIVYTVVTLGTPGTMLSTDASVGTFNTTTGAFTITGSSAIDTTPVYFYPSQPVMGLSLYEVGPVNDHPAYGFDTQFAYVYTSGAWQWSNTGGVPLWHGGNSNFFWAANWQGITPNLTSLFVSNFQVTNYNGNLVPATDDPIWAFSGTSWQAFRPVFLNAGNLVQTARVVLAFRNRLILLNTVEITPGSPGTNANYVNRCRFSQNGSPFDSAVMIGTTDGTGALSGISPGPNLTTIGQYFLIGFSTFVVTTAGVTQPLFAVGTGTGTYSTTNGAYSFTGAPINTPVYLFNAPIAWLEQNQVGSKLAGYIDATTEEAIISAEFIKDRLIVYFERSTWELAYTGNEVQPFNWYKINTELGSEATFSTVPFDKVVLGIGQTGIHACNGANVIRVDSSIPDQVFQISDQTNGFARVCGIRDYYVEMVYWAFPNSAQQQNSVFPNKVLVYNYKNQSWALNDDSITAFGYFEQQLDTTWETATFTWGSSSATWSSGVLQTEFRQVIAGNQEGYTFLVLADEHSNAGVLQITNMTYDAILQEMELTIINHNLEENIPEALSFISISGAIGVTYSGPGIYEVSGIIDINTIRVILTADQPSPPNVPTFVGTYQGGAVAARVSNINFLTKQWNFYTEQAKNAHIQRIDFNVNRTTGGEITVDYYPSFTTVSLVQAGGQTGAIMGSNVLETSPYDVTLAPLESEQKQLWHPIYFQTVGETIQLSVYFDEAQMQQPEIAFADFQLNAMIIHAQPAGRIQ